MFIYTIIQVPERTRVSSSRQATSLCKRIKSQGMVASSCTNLKGGEYYAVKVIHLEQSSVEHVTFKYSACFAN